MKKLVVALLMLTGCGVETITGPTGPIGPAGETGAQGEKGDKGDTLEVPTEAKFEGYFLLPNGGYLDVYEDAQSLYTARTMRLVVVNKDGSTGALPIVSATNMAEVDSIMTFVGNVTYAAGNNVKQDNGTVLVGSFLTQLVFSLKNDKLNIQVLISNSSALLVDRTLEEK